METPEGFLSLMVASVFMADCDVSVMELAESPERSSQGGSDLLFKLEIQVEGYQHQATLKVKLCYTIHYFGSCCMRLLVDAFLRPKRYLLLLLFSLAQSGGNSNDSVDGSLQSLILPSKTKVLVCMGKHGRLFPKPCDTVSLSETKVPHHSTRWASRLEALRCGRARLVSARAPPGAFARHYRGEARFAAAYFEAHGLIRTPLVAGARARADHFFAQAMAERRSLVLKGTGNDVPYNIVRRPRIFGSRSA